MTPRRSSRARNQPSPAILQHTNSSSSSNSMARERSTRSNHKISSPQRSSTNRSQSIDDADTGSKSDFRETRQRQRARGEEDNDHHMRLEDGDDDDGEEEDEEEEITRCLCGQQEYPGLPPSRRDLSRRNGLRAGIKDEAFNLTADASDLLPDEIGSMFIQCDSCKVWQHGGCVGIMDEAMSPDEYFCEECRKDLHKIISETNGSYSSQYLPVAPPPSTAPSSRESSRETSRRAKEPKPRHNDPTNPKRRSTMNSRDAAYDEEEQLRRAIEESKEDNKPAGDDIAARRPKRSRSDSEAQKQATKRQRTSSPSPGAVSKSNPASQPVSEDESKKPATNGVRRQRAASRSQRDKETKEPEEPEAEQPEAPPRRKSRSERQKGDDAESDHEAGSPTKPNASEPEPKQPSPEETPAPAQEAAPSRPSTRKSGRPPARRGGRIGRNQYTRDRDTNGTDSTTRSPRRGQSHDLGGDSPRVGVNGTHINSSESGKPSRPRYVNQRTTMNEMKRRVTAILEFISRMQVEMAVAGESTTPPGNDDRPNGITRLLSENQLLSSAIESAGLEGGSMAQPAAEKDFKDLSSVEMMDVLTRHLLKWQQEYGKFGER
ncbi:putative transcriptional regulator (Cti6) [Aspergillus luchuensis]|uniref:Transcriptional regulator n=1 Tax=Aspergillus kawachii TaxID=1069201 RepID=A0A146F1X1_ASPKA|nr:uncharacterized protein AKAW2_11752A [Aspergillus luchuensis]BCR94706.1 hypothetical protein AKAW2_11752A [Aspergillus luchuensis]BCS07294.1 hypothetical protein ALUC_11675A [Aspergillus luchuensis]GAA86259.1 transcriptional regulator [Aspergillus luchuensis IFO 4308]GAT19793.1 transcriptional regulator [Aspergillus luchuensis]